MKTYEVILDKPTLVDDWCLWDNRTIKRRVDHTIAILTAFSDERLKQKITKLYPGVRVISIKEIK